jgi:hypothetical protein
MSILITIPGMTGSAIIVAFVKLLVSNDIHHYSNARMNAAQERAVKERELRWHRLKTLARCTFYRLLVLAIIFLTIFFVIAFAVSVLLGSFVDYAVYLLEIGLAGYFVVGTISHLVYGLVRESSPSQARSARG